MCSAYRDLLKAAGVAQEQTVFLGAVVCALAAGVLALVLFRGVRDARDRRRRGTPLRGLIARRAGAPASVPARGRTSTTCWPPTVSSPRLRPRRLRRDRARRRRHRDLHGLAASTRCSMVGLKPGDAKIFRNPGGRVTAAGARGAGARRAPARRRADPDRPAHPVRDDREHPSRSCGTQIGESAGVDAAWQFFSVVEDQLAALEEDVQQGAHPPADPGVGPRRRVPVRRRHRPARQKF